MKKWNFEKVTIFTILLLVVVTVFSISFAYFTVEIQEGDLFNTEGKANKGTTPDIEYTENKPGISLTNTYPMPDSVGIKNEDVYTYTVENKDTTNAVNIQVMFEVLGNSSLEDNLVNYLLDDDISTFGGTNTTRTTSSVYKTSYIIDSFTLQAGGSKTSNLRLWINENGTIENAQNKTWGGRIVVTASFVE